MDNMLPYGQERNQNFHLINLSNLNFIVYSKNKMQKLKLGMRQFLRNHYGTLMECIRWTFFTYIHTHPEKPLGILS